MTREQKPGLLIAIEGVDGAGSSTQAQLLFEYFQSRGLSVHLTAEPSKGPFGTLARSYLSTNTPAFKQQHTALALVFAADRLHHYETEIAPQLQQGTHVISDRYVLSSWVYQGLHLPQEWVESINRYAKAPDITFLVDVDEPIARQRRLSRNTQQEIFDDSVLQDQLIKRYRQLLPNDGITIDGNLSVEQVHHAIVEALKSL